MTYDLRRLRLHGLIERIPNTHSYVLTPEGIRVVFFYTKVRHRILAPLLETDAPPAPAQVRQALVTLDRAVRESVMNARLGLAA